MTESIVLPRRATLALACLVMGVVVAACSTVKAPSPVLVADPAASTGTPIGAVPSPASGQATALSTSATPALTSPGSTATPSNVPPTMTLDLPVAPRVGALAPEILLLDLTGAEVSLNGLRGNLVLLNFWTTW